MIKDRQYYFDIFSVTTRQLEELVGEGMRSGGDYCDLYFENTFQNSLVLRDGSVSSGGTLVDFGVGIRVLKGDKTGYAYSESTDMPSMLEAARAAASISRGIAIKAGPASAACSPDPLSQACTSPDSLSQACGSPLPDRPVSPVCRYFGTPNPAADRYPVKRDWREYAQSQMLSVLERIDRGIRARESSTEKVMVVFSSQMRDLLMFNSFEELKYDTHPMGSISVSAVFRRGDRRETGTSSRSFSKGAEMIDDSLVEALISEAVEGVDASFEARRPKGGRMSVVMGAGASGILLHEAMGHSFEADFNRKRQSIFSDKLGKRVCPKGITIVDDATLRGNRGALNFDDEGVPGQYTVMVGDGVLTSYLHDRISADHYGVKPTGNGRRESFRYNPIPRMRTTYMENGEAKAADLIASVDKGIFVDKFANGQVKIGEGDFTFYVKSGFLIEKGRLTMPIKDVNIIGNGPQALEGILGVADDLKIDDGTWTCGKEQSVPVSCGMPTVLVRELTVGGDI